MHSIHRFKTGVCLGIALLSGCASTGFNKATTVSATAMEAARSQLTSEEHLARALVQAPIAAAPFCINFRGQEPFFLTSSAPVRATMTEESRAAFWRVGGIDDTWRVLWAAPEAGLSRGDQVSHIDGRVLSAERMTDLIGVLTPARADALKSGFMTVTVVGKGDIRVATRKACDGVLNSWAFGNIATDQRVPRRFIDLPGAGLAPDDEDAARWLAYWGVFWLGTADAEAANHKSLGTSLGVLALGVLFPPALLLTAPSVGMLTANAINGAAATGMVDKADLFAAAMLAQEGRDPMAGIRVNERLKARPDTRGSALALSPEREKRLRSYVEGSLQTASRETASNVGVRD